MAEEEQYYGGRPVARTSFLPVAALVAGVAPVVAGVGTTITVVNAARTYYTEYQRGRQALAGLTGLFVSAAPTVAPAPAPAASIGDIISSSVTGGLLSTAGLTTSAMLALKAYEIMNSVFATRRVEPRRLEHHHRVVERVVENNKTMEENFNKHGPHWLQTLDPKAKTAAGTILVTIALALEQLGADVMREKTQGMATDYQFPVQAGLLPRDSDGWLFHSKLNLRRQCYQLYMNSAYYTNKGEPSFWDKVDVRNWNVVRIVANIMIGALKPLLNTGGRDPVTVFLTAAELTGYCEMLARLVGLYGWAPVYVATHWLTQTMFPSPMLDAIKKEAAPPSTTVAKKKKKKGNAFY